MTKGQRHLNLVTEKLNSKIAEMSAVIEEVQNDIVIMNYYYWEN